MSARVLRFRVVSDDALQTLRSGMERAESRYTAGRSPMRTSPAPSTPKGAHSRLHTPLFIADIHSLDCCAWPTRVRTQTALNFSSHCVHVHISMVRSISIVPSFLVTKTKARILRARQACRVWQGDPWIRGGGQADRKGPCGPEGPAVCACRDRELRRVGAESQSCSSRFVMTLCMLLTC